MKQKKVIAVMSPVAAGKTFIAVNLAAVAARGERVALVDLDFKEKAISTWLNIPDSARDYVAEKSGMQVYFASHGVSGHSSSLYDNFEKYLASIKAETVILDMPRMLENIHEEALKHSKINVWVGDPDYHRLVRLREERKARQDEQKPELIVVNNYKKLQIPLYYEKMFGGREERLDRFEGVYDSILTGVPLIETDIVAREMFERLYQKIKIKTQGGIK